MNFYIDFDNTLYNTKALTFDMLENLALYISKTQNVNKEDLLKELKSKFNRENIYNIFELCKYFENKYNMQNSQLQLVIIKTLENGSRYVYSDVDQFLEKLKGEDCNLFILTKADGEDNIEYQKMKIEGSEIKKYFSSDPIIITKPKGELELDYKNGIFIDDNPKELKSLYDAGAKRIIRIKRPNAKYSNEELNISEIEEYTELSDIPDINKENERQEK